MSWLREFRCATILGMRASLLLTAILGVGCASQATDSNTVASEGRPTLTEAQRLRVANNLNLKLVDQDGQKLFCRANFVTASRIQRDTTCYTADELDKLEARQQRELDQMSLRAASGGLRTP